MVVLSIVSVVVIGMISAGTSESLTDRIIKQTLHRIVAGKSGTAREIGTYRQIRE